MKPEDFFQPRIENVDSKTLRYCSTLISLELARRVEKDQPVAADCLIEAAKHATDSFFDLFKLQPYRFRGALKKRTNCPVPMPANKKAREQVLNFMSENTTFNVEQKYSIDIRNSVYVVLIRQLHKINQVRAIWEAGQGLNFPMTLDNFEQQCVDLPELNNIDEARLQWFGVSWEGILRDTDGEPHNHGDYKNLGPDDDSGFTKDDLQRKLHLYFKRLLSKRD